MKVLILVVFAVCTSVQAQTRQANEPAPVFKPSQSCIAADGFAVVCRTDERAYRHALQEARILASELRVYHPLGCAPGTSASGCGSSSSANRPHHCFYRSGKKLIARARVKGRDGRFYFSAHYR